MEKQEKKCQRLDKFKPYFKLLELNVEIGNCVRFMEIGKRLQRSDMQQRAFEFIQSHLGKCMERRDSLSLIGSLTYSKQDLDSLLFLLQTTGLKSVNRKKELLASLLSLFHKDAGIFESYFVEHKFHSFENCTVQERSSIENSPTSFSETLHNQRVSGKLDKREKNVTAKITGNNLFEIAKPDWFLSQCTRTQNQPALTENQFKPCNGDNYRTKTHFGKLGANVATLNKKNLEKNGCQASYASWDKSKHDKDTKRKLKDGVVDFKTDFTLALSSNSYKRTPDCRHTVQRKCKTAQHDLANSPQIYRPRNSESNTRIVVVGGIVSSENLDPSCSVHLYDPNLNSWQPLPPMRHPRVNHAVTVLDGHVYVAGGNKGAFTQTNTVERYNLSSCAWSDVFPMTEVREELSLVQVENELYAIGGYNGMRDLASVEYYNPRDDIWRFSTPLHTCRAGAAVVVYEQCIYVIGGSCNQRHMTSLEVYDTAAHAWRTGLQCMREGRSYACAAIVENKIYVMGGFNRSGYLKTCEVLDLKELEWRWFPSMLRRRMNAGVATLANKVYIFGGESDGVFLSSVERYDVKRGKWEIITELPTTLTGSRATSVVLN